MERYHLTLWVNDKFRPAPRDHFSLIGLSIEKYTILPQELINWVSWSSVYVDLWEHWELDIELCHSPFFDWSFVAGLLLKELVVGEGKDFETLSPVLLMELNQFFIVLFSQPSLANHIYNHSTLLIANQFAKLANFGSINGSRPNFKQTLRLAFNLLALRFRENIFTCKIAHLISHF